MVHNNGQLALRRSTVPVARDTAPGILDQNGLPWHGPPSKRVSSRDSSAIRKSFAAYLSSLFQLDMDPLYRATEPFANHAWIYSAAMARAINIAQAPFAVFQETAEATDDRRAQAKRAGRPWFGPKAGTRRRAVRRHLTRSACPGRFLGMPFKKLEIDLDHPLMDLFNRPSPQLSGAQLWQVTELWMALRGEAVWLLLDENGGRRSPGTPIGEAWPISPDVIFPVKKQGRLIAWRYRITGQGTGVVTANTMTGQVSPLAGGMNTGIDIFLGLHEIVQFKYPAMNDPWRGFAPITPVAATVNLDMLAKDRNRAVLMNGADPGGILIDESGESWDEDEQRDFMEKFEDRHKGTGKSREISVLPTGIKYIPVGMSPQEMEYLEGLKYGRDEIFAVQRTPKTIVGVTDAINYSTQLGQDRNFTDKTLIPEWLLFEDTLDATIFFKETDDIVGAFDLSNVEALRLGIEQKIKTASQMSGAGLHTPPRIALQLVGLTDVPRYDGDDVSLVNPLLADAALIAAGKGPLGFNSPPGATDEQAKLAADDEAVLLGEAIERLNTQEHNKVWQAIVLQVQQPMELLYIPIWRSWVINERRAQLKRFDDQTRKLGLPPTRTIDKQDLLDFDILLTPIVEMQNRLKLSTRPLYAQSLESVYNFTVEVDLGGIPIFALDDPRLISFFDLTERQLIGTAPKTIQNNLRKSLRRGIADGETVQELRTRVALIFDISSSSAKALQIARTESGAFMNGARDTMFDAQGFDNLDWVTAGDETVRSHHVAFGRAGPHPRGFNYLSIIGDSGMLTRPHDPDAPAKEVVNCRCIMVPA